MNKYTVYCSFLQIYNENLYDLLQDEKLKNSLKIREDSISGIYVEGLAEFVVNNARDCYALMKRGERNRITKATRANIQSSRSHSIFQLWVETDQVDKRGMLKRAKLNLCDLAGSEKIINKEESITKAHFMELKTINLSLTTLGKVIAALSRGLPNKKTPMNKESAKISIYSRKFRAKSIGTWIPYRESKLTRLLQDSLGGNTRTCLIAAVSPIDNHSDETISTLKFADRAKQVMVKIKANELDATDDALVQKLHEEVVHLRQVLNLRKKGKIEEVQHQLIKLQKENNRLKKIASNVEEVERLKLENKIMRLELQKIKQEEGSQYIEGGSNHETMSQLNIHNYELHSMTDKNGIRSEIEKPIYQDSRQKCPLWDTFPPWIHYGVNSDYEPQSAKAGDNVKTHRIESSLLQKKKTLMPKLARSRENFILDEENPYSMNDFHSRSIFNSVEDQFRK
jgi:hypothetical protein